MTVIGTLTALSNVGFRGQSGQHLLVLSLSAFDPQQTSAALAIGWQSCKIATPTLTWPS
jgi:hypothetical protein